MARLSPADTARALAARLCPCCVPEELEPLRVSHVHGISSDDRPAGRSTCTSDDDSRRLPERAATARRARGSIINPIRGL